MEHQANNGSLAVRFVILAVVIIVFGGAAYYYFSHQSGEEAQEYMEDDSGAMKGETMEAGDDGAMTDGEVMVKSYSGTVIAGKDSPLLDFTQTDYEQAIQTNKLVVLYFYANWCPICKEEVANALYPAFNELSGDRVVGFRINFNDNETDAYEKQLASQFGVAYQHTKVFLKGGQRVLKAPESWSKSQYLSEISGAMAN